MALAACGDGTASTTTVDGDTGDTTATTAPSGEPQPTITIVANAWTASALNAEVAKQLIETEFGYPVEIVAIDENTMFSGLSDGSLDAVLELWPSGISADEQAFLDDGSAVNIGELGAVGQIGWFVPQYLIDEHPELATWKGFLDPELAALFATAETGDLGRFLATDPPYSQYDEPIVANPELPLKVIYSGSEAATVAELDARVAANEPIVMYWWTPTAAYAKYNLVQMELPEYSDECYADPAAVDCAYPPDVLRYTLLHYRLGGPSEVAAALAAGRFKSRIDVATAPWTELRVRFERPHDIGSTGYAEQAVQADPTLDPALARQDAVGAVATFLDRLAERLPR